MFFLNRWLIEKNENVFVFFVWLCMCDMYCELIIRKLIDYLFRNFLILFLWNVESKKSINFVVEFGIERGYFLID